MRAPIPALLPLATAAALVMGAGDAKALTIRYSFTGGSSDYRGGTIEVGSLDQTLDATPVTFTVDILSSQYTVVASYFAGSSTEIDFSTPACGGICFDSWNPSNFNFGTVPGGAISSSTTWRSLLGTFGGSNSGAGDFTWSISSPQTAGTMTPPPSAITFSAADVPGPLPALGAAAAFGWSRRLRKRIGASGRSASRLVGRDA